MKKKLIYSALAICFAFRIQAQAPTAADPNQPQLIEKVSAKPGELVIPYEKWKLPNGLTIIVHEDHSDPIVHVEVAYHVGSARETAGKSGFAHFFEHMMFQGSDHVKDEEHDKIVGDAGGFMNGNTSQDRTVYFEEVPSNYLGTALWLEADRMGFLLDAVTQKKFEVQRATVKNEKGQGVDNVPYGKTDEIKGQILYPQNHPYNWPVIGYVEDLDRVNVEDLKNFFMRWYGPNNAALVVAGDVKTQEVVNLAMKYFGSIPRGPEVRKQRVEPVRLPQNVYANYGDKVYFPLTQIVYPGVPNYHPDEAPLDMLAGILGDGNNSIFYKNFVKSEKAIQVGVSNPCSELAGEFTVQVLSYPPQFQEEKVDVEALVKQTFDDFEKNGVDDDALTRAKARIESNYIQGTQTLIGKVGVLVGWYYLQPNKSMNVSDEIARYNKVTKDDVMRVYRQYIKGKNAAIVNVFPKDANAASTKEEVKVATSSGKASSELEYKGLSYKKPIDNFDRNQKPEAAGSVSPVVPKFYTTKFDNGMSVIGTSNSETPFVTLLLNIRGGNYAVGNDLGKSGLANLTAAMMEEATQKYTSEQFSNELDKLGANISFSTGREFTSVVVNSPKKNLDKVLVLFEEKLLHPKFTSEDFKRVQRQIAENINSQKVSANDMANKAYARLVYGKSIAAEPVDGTIKNIKGMSVKDVQGFYDKFYSPTVANLVIVGDVSESEIMPKLSFLKAWPKKDVQLPQIASAAPAIEKTQIYLVDKYKAPQSEIRVGYLAMPYDYNGKYFRAGIMNYTFGGGFINSRLNLNLREDKGYTYGIYAFFSGTHNPAPFTIAAGVKDSVTDLSIKEIMYEVKKYHDNGISDEEMSFTKKSMIQSDALRYEGPFQKAGFLNQIVNYNLPADYIDQQTRIVQGISKDDVNALAKELLPADKMVIVIVGDRDKIKAPLEKLGYKVVDYKLD